jgi:hypothetical protein
MIIKEKKMQKIITYCIIFVIFIGYCIYIYGSFIGNYISKRLDYKSKGTSRGLLTIN